MYPPFGPIFFQLGPLTIRWYGVIMVIAILISCWIASRYVTHHGEDSTTIWDMLLWVLIPALIGERLYYVFFQAPRGPNGLGRYLANPIEILRYGRAACTFTVPSSLGVLRWYFMLAYVNFLCLFISTRQDSLCYQVRPLLAGPTSSIRNCTGH